MDRGLNQLIYTLAILHLVAGREEIIKWLKQSSEVIRISCPSKHVLYNPSIVAGSTEFNCTGNSPFFQGQVESCHWRKRCDIKLINNDRITCRGTTAVADHVIFKQPYCIPNDIIFDVCDGEKQFRTMGNRKGVLRSHRGYPRKLRRSREPCSLNITVKRSETLVIAAVSKLPLKRYPANTKIFRTDRISGLEEKVLSHDTNTLMFPGNTTKGIRIVTSFGGRKRKVNRLKGFLLPYVAYESRSLDDVLTWPVPSRPMMREIGWIYEVRAVIEQCMTGRKRGVITLQCGKDEVIYSPAFAVSAYTRSNPKCIFGRYPCGGFTADNLIQRNSCYWKSSCNVTWQGSQPIIMSKVPSCIAYQASNLGLTGHRCVQKENIFNLCSNCTSHINSDWGIIRSHHSYPWYFDTTYDRCKRILRVGRGREMRLVFQDFNVDPDGLDKFKVEHVVKFRRKVLLNAKSATEGRQLVVTGGRIVIRFTPFSPKSGRGFIIVFRRYKATKASRRRPHGFTDSIVTLDDQALNDQSSMPDIKLSNRRLCSGSAEERKNGKACGPRVWSDYFTRLE